MKKLTLCAMVLFATTMYAQQETFKQCIITDCGTVHEIPANSTPEEALAWLDFWTSIDC